MLLDVEPKVERVFGPFALEEQVVAVQVDRWPRVCGRARPMASSAALNLGESARGCTDSS